MKNNLILLLILILSFIIRLINLNQSLWHDESGNVIYANTLDLWSYITKYPIGDFHPPGYFFILWIWGHIFDFSEVSIRMPSVIFGILTIWLIYLIGKELFSKKVGLIAALFLTLAPLHIYYSQEARTYSFAAFAVSLSFYWLFKLIKGVRFSFLGYGISVALILYSDYLPYFVLPAQIIYIFFLEKRNLNKFFSSLMLGVIMALPWLIFFPQQFIYGYQIANRVTGWAQVVGGATIQNALLLPVKILVGRVNFDEIVVYVLIIGLISIPYLCILKNIFKGIREDKNRIGFLFWLIIPVILAFGISFFIPVFSYFRMIFILPAFYLLTASMIEKLNSRWKIVCIIAVIVGEVAMSGIYLLNADFQREDWRNSVAFVVENSDQNSIVLFENDEILSGFKYYANTSINALAGIKMNPVKTQTDLVDLDNLLAGKNKVFVYEYLFEVTDPNRLLKNKIINMGYSPKGVYNFRGIGFVEIYEK